MPTGGKRATRPRNTPTDAAPIPPRPDLRRFKTELTPTWLDLATTLAGHRAPDRADGWRAAYLGGGHGFTTAVVAAVHPEAQVWWWDPDVSAVEAARRLRDGAALTNLTVHEQPEPGDLGGGPLDLVVIDGVLDSAPDLGWYGLIDAIAGSLRPGGLVCVTYRTQVGWQEITPVHRLIRHLVARDPRPTLEAIADVCATLRLLRDGGAAYVTQRPVVTAWLDEVLSLSAADFADQVADRELSPVSHARLRDVLGRTGCEYVGPAHPTDIAPPDLSQRLAAIVTDTPSPVVRETLTDLALRRTHRCDVFRLGAAPLPTADRHKRIGSLQVTGLGRVDPDDRSLRSIARVATLRSLAAGQIYAAELPGTASGREATVRRLLATGLIHPVPTLSGTRRMERHGAPARVTGHDTGPAERLNAIISKPPTPTADRVLVSQVLATAVPLAGKLDRYQREALGIR